jgi:dolichol kinase
VPDFVISAAIVFGYYLMVVAVAPTLLRMWFKAPAELVRKLQHLGYTLSVFLLLELFVSWYAAIAGAFLLVIVAYPVLWALEKTAFYRQYLVDRRKGGGELRRSMLLVQLSFALLIALIWGGLGHEWRYLVAVPVMAWGYGDAAAALIGKWLGRRHFRHHYIDSLKTHEGTGAMIVVAALAIFVTLLWYVGKPWPVSLLVAAITAPVCGVVELFSRRGLDTLTVPLAAAALAVPLLYVSSLLGW